MDTGTGMYRLLRVGHYFILRTIATRHQPGWHYIFSPDLACWRISNIISGENLPVFGWSPSYPIAFVIYSCSGKPCPRPLFFSPKTLTGVSVGHVKSVSG